MRAKLMQGHPQRQVSLVGYDVTSSDAFPQKVASTNGSKNEDEGPLQFPLEGCTEAFKCKASVGRHMKSSKVHANSVLRYPNPECGRKSPREYWFLRHLGKGSFAKCLAAFLNATGVENLGQCDSQQIAAKCGVVYTPGAGDDLDT